MMFFDVTTGNPQFDKQNLRFVKSKVHFLVTFYQISNLITFSIIGKNFTSTHITSYMALDIAAMSIPFLKRRSALIACTLSFLPNFKWINLLNTSRKMWRPHQTSVNGMRVLVMDLSRMYNMYELWHHSTVYLHVWFVYYYPITVFILGLQNYSISNNKLSRPLLLQ